MPVTASRRQYTELNRDLSGATSRLQVPARTTTTKRTCAADWSPSRGKKTGGNHDKLQDAGSHYSGENDSCVRPVQLTSVAAVQADPGPQCENRQQHRKACRPTNPALQN